MPGQQRHLWCTNWSKIEDEVLVRYLWIWVQRIHFLASGDFCHLLAFFPNNNLGHPSPSSMSPTQLVFRHLLQVHSSQSNMSPTALEVSPSAASPLNPIKHKTDCTFHSRRFAVSYKRKYLHELLVNRLFKPAQEKVWLGELTVSQWP